MDRLPGPSSHALADFALRVVTPEGKVFITTDLNSAHLLGDKLIKLFYRRRNLYENIRFYFDTRYSFLSILAVGTFVIFKTLGIAAMPISSVQTYLSCLQETTVKYTWI